MSRCTAWTDDWLPVMSRCTAWTDDWSPVMSRCTAWTDDWSPVMSRCTAWTDDWLPVMSRCNDWTHDWSDCRWCPGALLELTTDRRWCPGAMIELTTDLIAGDVPVHCLSPRLMAGDHDLSEVKQIRSDDGHLCTGALFSGIMLLCETVTSALAVLLWLMPLCQTVLTYKRSMQSDTTL